MEPRRLGLRSAPPAGLAASRLISAGNFQSRAPTTGPSVRARSGARTCPELAFYARDAERSADRSARSRGLKPTRSFVGFQTPEAQWRSPFTWGKKVAARGESYAYATCARSRTEQTVQRRAQERKGATSSPSASVCSKFAPYCERAGARRAADVAPLFPGKQKPQRNKVAATYLGDSFLISHDSLLDQRVDFNVPVPARNHHPRPAKTHRDFHGSVSELVPRFGVKPSRGGRREIRVGIQKEHGLVPVRLRGGPGRTTRRSAAPRRATLCRVFSDHLFGFSFLSSRSQPRSLLS